MGVGIVPEELVGACEGGMWLVGPETDRLKQSERAATLYGTADRACPDGWMNLRVGGARYPGNRWPMASGGRRSTEDRKGRDEGRLAKRDLCVGARLDGCPVKLRG